MQSLGGPGSFRRISFAVRLGQHGGKCLEECVCVWGGFTEWSRERRTHLFFLNNSVKTCFKYKVYPFQGQDSMIFINLRTFSSSE